MEPEFHIHYYSDLLRTNLLPERGIYLENMSEKLPAFHDKFEVTGWRCFASDPCIAKEQCIANISYVSFPDTFNVTIKIQGKSIRFGVEQINDVYELQHDNIGEFKEKGCKPGSWFA